MNSGSLTSLPWRQKYPGRVDATRYIHGHPRSILTTILHQPGLLSPKLSGPVYRTSVQVTLLMTPAPFDLIRHCRSPGDSNVPLPSKLSTFVHLGSSQGCVLPQTVFIGPHLTAVSGPIAWVAPLCCPRAVEAERFPEGFNRPEVNAKLGACFAGTPDQGRLDSSKAQGAM